MSVKIDIDAREFTQAIREYAKLRKMDDQQVVADRTGKLAFELFKQFKAVGPSVSALRSLPTRLHYRIERAPGKTVVQEINRRIAARTSAAIGWIPAVRRFSNKSGSTKAGAKGGVTINLSEPSVTISNDMKQALFAEEKYHLMQKTVDGQTAEMRVYIERKLEKRAKQFSSK